MPLLSNIGIHVPTLVHNAPPAELYEAALCYESGSAITSTGALVALSGEKTGRSPTDKRIVDEPETHDNVWWGPVNIPLDRHTFDINRERAIDYLNTRERLYVVDGYAGWDPRHSLKVRIVCARAYHALFMSNMLIRPTSDQLRTFGEPDYLVLNGGAFPANRFTAGMTSATSVDLSLGDRTLVILGTEYAGEMKKGVFTVMNSLMPARGNLSMHCSATEGKDGSTSVLFGLSGTGKTTLSADPKRRLIGDDEHVWADQGIFNIEGGCYAKTLGLEAEAEPEIFQAIRFGTVLENVVLDPVTRKVDYDDDSITKNSRASYPLEFIENVKLPAVGAHPTNVIFLTCDAFGVLPPVARLSPEQAMYHFISGYTAKVAGTEMGVDEPEATFSPCFGGPFLVWHPAKYAELLAERLNKHGSRTWLVNTGWSGGPYGTGKRMKLSLTRAIIDAIHDGSLAEAPMRSDPTFGFDVPLACRGVSSEVLDPRATWADKAAFDAAAKALAKRFAHNFERFRAGASRAARAGGPTLEG